MDAAPRLLGFQRAIRLAEFLAGSRRGGSDAAAVALIARRLAIAAAFYPRRALCLEQSLALYVLLRRSGLSATLQIGVQPMPFYAHAWVEADGRAINEPEGRIEHLSTFQLGV
jgi:hypothetical protein